MKILLVAPGALYSTFDIFRYYRAALKRAGVKVQTFNYHNNYLYHSAAITAIEDAASDDQTVAKRAMQLAAEDLISRVARAQPDWVLVISGIALPVVAWPWLKDLRDSLRSPFKMSLLFTECPYIDDWQLKILPFIDVAFIMDTGSLAKFRAINPETHYLAHAYEPTVHRPYTVGPGFECDIFMCATGFPERQEMLERVNWNGIDLRLYGQWEHTGDKSSIRPYITEKFLDNDICASWYNGAKLSLNIFRTATWYADKVEHIEDGIAESLGPRCFEVMACGGTLVSNNRPEFDRLFEPDCAVIFEAGNLQDKITHYLANPNARDEVAQAGLEAVQGHTYDARVSRLLEFF